MLEEQVIFTEGSKAHPLVEAAIRLEDKLLQLAAETDDIRRLPDDTIANLTIEGLLAALTPKKYGGFETSLQTLFDVVLELGKADGSVAWTYTVLCCGSWMVSTFFPEIVGSEVFQSPNPLTCAVMSPVKIEASRIDGGVMITAGTWTFNSGIHHAGWDVVGIPIARPGEAPHEMLIGLIPTNELTILDDWNTIGLRGTGSCSVVANNVFVPDRRLTSHVNIIAGDYPHGGSTNSPLYCLPVVPTVMIKMALPSIAIAKGALGLFCDLSRNRGIPSTSYRKQSDAAVTHIQVAEASSRIDAAETIIRRAITELEAAAKARRPVTLLQRSRMWRDVGFACRLAWEATDLLAGASGGSFARESNRLNRYWRDARVATSHAALCTPTTFEAYGRVLYGLPSNSPLLPT